MVAVAAVAVAGWLLLLVALLALPPRVEGATPAPPAVGEPPAVVSLVAGRLGRDGFGATLADLAARGWFRLSGERGPSGPIMCVVPAETPAEPLAPYERRVLAHLALRAGAAGQVPAPALSDGFEGGEAAFMGAFREEVTADAVGRGLIRRRLSGQRIALLCVALGVPAVALGVSLAAHRQDTVGISSVVWFLLSLVTIAIGRRRCPTAAGRAVLDRWQAAADAARRGGTNGQAARLGAYAAALGRAPDAVAVFASGGRDTAWSGYRGTWRQIPVETSTWSWRAVLAVMFAVIGGLVLFAGALAWLGSNGLGTLVEPLGQLTGLLFVAGVVAWVLRRKLFPRSAEFDGQVIRQWLVGGGDDGPDQYHVAVDDGVRARAWNLLVSGALYQQLAPGTLVHARVSLWKPRQATVHLVEPAAVARQLADPGAPRDPRGPAMPEVQD